MTEEGRIRLLVVDDHPVVRTGLRGMLSEEPDFEVVGEASDGGEAVELFDRLSPDVVLMDLRLPEMDGTVAISKIKADHPEARILVLTTYDSDADILRAVEEGATGYLLKDAPREELFKAIRAASSGEPVLSPPAAERLMRQVRAAEEGDSLSAREVEVLELAARGKGNREIAKRLWIGETTVKTHLQNAAAKLGAHDRTEAVAVALRKEILSLEDPEG